MFFAAVKDRSALERVEFYKQDIEILRESGFEIAIATRWREIPSKADLYFVWWWTWAFMPLVKTERSRRPCLVTGTLNYDTPFRRAYHRRPFWQRALIAYALRRAAASVFVSQLEYQQVTQAPKVNNPCYIPHSVETDIYRKGIQPREDFLLSVAWLQRENASRKCLPEIIEAFSIIRQKHSQMRLLIAGEKESSYLQLAQRAWGLGVAPSVEFLGVISREQKIDLMQRCKVYTAPSHYEGFGLGILEAISCGAPLVAAPWAPCRTPRRRPSMFERPVE